MDASYSGVVGMAVAVGVEARDAGATTDGDAVIVAIFVEHGGGVDTEARANVVELQTEPIVEVVAWLSLLRRSSTSWGRINGFNFGDMSSFPGTGMGVYVCACTCEWVE